MNTGATWRARRTIGGFGTCSAGTWSFRWPATSAEESAPRRRTGLKDHNATVTTFYLSNVERYLFQGSGNQNGGWTTFYDNVAALPLDASSTFIRSGAGGFRGGGSGMRSANVLAGIQDTLAAVEDGRIRTYSDIFSIVKQ